ncbi:SemiSWEET family sugar transporter [Candidatus Neptunichlamydia sp. REUL1]|uniref:SemiSWEET family sugar transporter n=1 Tax=Candidatus Neptunichlamydia sp. REUL1 TaxID=3064277 RepID=UPI00292FB017|nr:SemiSWEET family transporter [Candidatus Neptunochlamydia sp. REUL1]
MILLVISIVASATSVLSLIPQIYRTYQLKSASDLSLLMLINFLVCSLSWVAYGGLTGMVFVWVTNVMMTIFSIVLIVFKIRYTPKVKQCG